MKTLSVKQPWAYLIASGIKDIENRTWKCPEKYIGQRVLIHASAKPEKIGFEMEGQATVVEIQRSSALSKCEEDGLFSAIIGSVEMVDCVINHASIWAEKSLESVCPICGRKITDTKPERQWCPDCRMILDKDVDYHNPVYNWVIANPILFDEPILNVKGKLGFWDYEFDESTFDCTNNNPYVHQGSNEREGCCQCCDDCDYWRSKYELNKK